jgi:hypothetical protein
VVEDCPPASARDGRSLIALAGEYIRIMPFCGFKSCERSNARTLVVFKLGASRRDRPAFELAAATSNTRMVNAAFTKLGSVPPIHVIVTCCGWSGMVIIERTVQKGRIHSLGEAA